MPGPWLFSFFPRMVGGGAELLYPFSEEAPSTPELLQVGAARRIQCVDLARWPLFGWDLRHVHEAPLFDPDQQRVDCALDDVGKALVPQPGRDFVTVGRLRGEGG